MVTPRKEPATAVERIHHHRDTVRDKLRKAGEHHRYVARRVANENQAAQAKLSQEPKQ